MKSDSRQITLDNMPDKNSQQPSRPKRYSYLKLLGIVVLAGVATAQYLLSLTDAQPAVLWGKVCEGELCTSAAVLRGEIPSDTDPIVDQLLRRPEVKTLCFASLGGHSSGGRDLSVWLDDHGYDTCVPKLREAQAFCASACTVAFIGGHKRRVDPGVNFAIHGAYMRVLLTEPPDVSDGAPGIFRYPSQPWLGISQALNKGTAWIERTWLQARTNPSPHRERLLTEVGRVPGHLVKRVTTAELTQWQTVTVPPATPLVFIPDAPPAPAQR